MTDLGGGFIGGLIQGQQDRQQYQLNEQSIKANALKLSAAAFEQKAQEDVAKAFQMATPEIMKEGTPDKMLLKMSSIAMQNNSPGMAAEYLAKSATAYNSVASAEQTDLETNIMSANAAVSLLDGVTDGPSLEAAYLRTQVQGIDTKGMIPTLYNHWKKNGGQWDEFLQTTVASGRRAITSAKDQAAIKLDEARIKTEEARAAQLRMQTSLVPLQAQEIRARTDKLRKAGTKATEMSASAEAYAKILINRDFGIVDADTGVPDEKAINVKAQEVLDYAQDLMKSTPTLKASEAVSKAYETLKAGNSFAGYEVKEQWLGSVRNPAPMPLVEGKINAEDLVEGSTYQGIGAYRGMLVKWNGTGFDPVVGAK